MKLKYLLPAFSWLILWAVSLPSQTNPAIRTVNFIKTNDESPARGKLLENTIQLYFDDSATGDRAKLNKAVHQKETVLEGLKRPWSIAFLSEEEAIIAEKEGGLVKVNLSNKQKVKIKGFPDDIAIKRVEYPEENDGIFEVLTDPNFNENKFVYVSYAGQNETGTATKVIRGILENDSLSQIQTIFLATPYASDRFHYGGGMTFGRDGKLYLTVGERLFSEADEPALPLAQDVQDRRGKIFRLNPDGSIPKDNPDFGAEAVPGLYATGIRAAQGITVEPETNKIWFSEHGTFQGDEINILKPYSNYGWPVRTTGKYRYPEYAPPLIKDNSYTDPTWFWLQTVAPTGLVFYTGDEFPLWKNNLIVAGLSRGSLWRFTVEAETIKSVEELFVDDRIRLRKVAQSPTGKLYILTDEINGKMIRIKNANTTEPQTVPFRGELKLEKQAADTVWTIDFVKTNDGQQTAFLKFIKANWAKARQTLQEKGKIASYQVLSLPPGKTSEWDVLLITEYINKDAHEKREELFAKVFKTQPTILINGLDGKDLREIKFSRVFNQPISSAVGKMMLATQTTDVETAAVRVPLENYLKGHETGDPEFMKKAFHATGNLIFIRDGKFTTRTFAEYIAGMSGKPAEDESKRQRRIESIDVAGNAAIGKIVLDYPTVKFVDYMTLLKIDGEWKIVNKSFYAEPKLPQMQK